jgi:hypothetical protein
MKDIIGNDFLISIAFKASSPTQAAKIAQLAGYSPEQVRGVRNAAKLKRDSGEEAFEKKYSPYNIVDISIENHSFMKMEVSVDRLYEKRNLNSAEFNELAEILESAVAGTKFKISIRRKETTGHIKK